jgi:hypothetical protein
MGWRVVPVVLAACCAVGATAAPRSLPDRALTQGAINRSVEPSTIGRTICRHGWAATIRPPSRYTSALKRKQIEAASPGDVRMTDYEEDHLIPLELGGAPYDVRNLWPEPRFPPDGWGAEAKDRLENRLNRMVCAGDLALDDAQRMIATDWTAAYIRIENASSSVRFVRR